MGWHGVSRWNAGSVFLTMSHRSAAAKRAHLISIGHVVPKLTLQDGAAESRQHEPHQSNHPAFKKKKKRCSEDNLLGCVARCRGETLIHDRTGELQKARVSGNLPGSTAGTERRITAAACFELASESPNPASKKKIIITP